MLAYHHKYRSYQLIQKINKILVPIVKGAKIVITIINLFAALSLNNQMIRLSYHKRSSKNIS